MKVATVELTNDRIYFVLGLRKSPDGMDPVAQSIYQLAEDIFNQNASKTIRRARLDKMSKVDLNCLVNNRTSMGVQVIPKENTWLRFNTWEGVVTKIFTNFSLKIVENFG